MLHLPLLRHGREYRSLDVQRPLHYRTRQPVAEISQANVGLIRRDMQQQQGARDTLARFSAKELIELCVCAGDLFRTATLPAGNEAQTPEDYVRQLASTTGMPRVLGRRNMDKIHAMFANMATVVAGLTRNLDLRILDDGYDNGPQPLSYFPRAQSMGVVLPSNSPGVHSLWIPAIALKTPLVLKPGSAEPWTPYRIVQAFLAAGCPAEAFSFYPTDHAGANEILRHAGRSMLFGDVGAVKHWAKDPRVELHGPGYSKVVIGEDCADEWPKYIELIARSIADNGGRSCVNASGVWVPRHADAIAAALAERLSKIAPRDEEDPEAGLAPFVDPNVAARINGMIDAGFEEPGAQDLSVLVRGTPRLAEWQGCSYLMPTVVRCDIGHPLANREFLFPFASVIETPQSELPEAMGPSLVVTAITRDRDLLGRLLASPHVGRLNIGAIPTNAIRWDQPHEGNLFDHLYSRRAFQMAEEPALA